MSTNLDKVFTYAPKVSLRSRLLHGLGCLFIGTPSSLGMPEDFYYIEADREFPTPGSLSWVQKRKRIYTDHFRRALTHKVALYACAVAVVFSVAGYAVNGGVRGAKSWISKTWSNSGQGKQAEAAWTMARCRQEYQQAMDQRDQLEMKRIENTCAGVRE